MLTYYGRDMVQQVVTMAPYLSDAAIAAVCRMFSLDKHNPRSYQRKQTILICIGAVEQANSVLSPSPGTSFWAATIPC